MKKGVIGIMLFIFLISFITAQHQICDPTDDANLQGVYINGVCYNCGSVSDSVCPEYYGADCSSVGGDADCPVETIAFWSLDGTTAINQLPVPLPDGRSIFLVVTNTGLSDGEVVSFDIDEDDIADDDITVVTTTSSGGKAVATWNITQEDLDKTDDYEHFFFTATGTDLDIGTKDRGDAYKYLNITTSFSGSSITQCSDYLDNVSCVADSENVGIGSPLQRDDNGCLYYIDWGCLWSEGNCSLSNVEEADAGNDPSCEGARTEPCVYENTAKQGDCEGGDDFFKITYSSTQTECETWTTGPIPCPAQVRLPFFSLFNIIASLSIISIVYAFLLRRS